MIQVTERARETFKNKLEDLIERPGVMLRIGSTDSGLEIFPDTLKDDDQIIEHDGRAVLLIDQEVSEISRTRRSTSRSTPTAFVSWSGDSRTTRLPASHEG